MLHRITIRKNGETIYEILWDSKADVLEESDPKKLCELFPDHKRSVGIQMAPHKESYFEIDLKEE
jgi:hypothetical protein